MKFFLIPSKYIKYKTNTRQLSAIILGIYSIILFFIPTIQIAVHNEQNNFYFSFFKILISPKFNLKLPHISALLSFPLSIQFIAIIIFILNILALSLIFIGKFKLSALLFFISGCCPVALLPNINELKNNLIDLQINSNKIFVEFLWPFFLFILLNLVCAILNILIIGKEQLAISIFLCMTCITLFFITIVIVYILTSSLTAIHKIGIFNLILKTEWNPNLNQFGIFNLIKSSIFSAVGAIVISAPIGILTAVFMSELCPKKLLFVIKPLVELLSGVPSVIFGFFGMSVIVPTIKKIFCGFKTSDGSPVVGDSLLAVIVVLIIMILPTIVNTSYTALKMVPKRFKEASLGLGATKTETIFKVCLPAAKPAIISGLILAIGRAIGETMAVIMVAGNIVKAPELLGTVRLLTTGIAIDLGYASGILKSALAAIGLVLLILIIAINFSFNLLLKKGSFSIEHR